MKRLIVALLVFLPVAAFAQGEPYRAGVHYDLIENANPAPRADGKVDVVELFSYVCPHCYSFQPHVKAWEETEPANAAFSRVPALLGRRSWMPYAKAYYTAEVMGVLDKTHDSLFSTLHVERVPLRTDADMAEFFTAHGVAADEYQRTSESFAVVTKMQRAQKLEREYGIRGTPTVVVAGKYRISANANIQPHNMFDVVDYLVAKEMAAVASAGEDDSDTNEQGSE